MSVSIPVFLVACGLTVSVQPAPSAPPSGIAQLAVGAPRDVVKLGGKGTRGVPSMVAWSPDGRQIYLRTSVWDQWGNENASHTIVDLIDIGIPTRAKSRKASPDDFYAAVPAALKAGADGLILSRKYSEMQLANLAAAGRAVRDAAKG